MQKHFLTVFFGGFIRALFGSGSHQRKSLFCRFGDRRSPSSRWPRPIGIIESIALMPVCTGSCTDLCVAKCPGLSHPPSRRSVASIGPLPSIGLPSGSTTRPSRPLPTGTSTIASCSFNRVPFFDVPVPDRRSPRQHCQLRGSGPCL